MRTILSFFLLLMFVAYCGAQDQRVLSTLPPPQKQMQQANYQEFVQVAKRDWALMLEIGTPAQRVLAYQPQKNRQISYEHYRWMMYRPSDYKDTGLPRPRPSGELVSVSLPR